jgi:hypothetical protein
MAELGRSRKQEQGKNAQMRNNNDNNNNKKKERMLPLLGQHFTTKAMIVCLPPTAFEQGANYTSVR